MEKRFYTTRRDERLRGNSQRLRREMTKEERHLWYDFLETLPVPVKRQAVVGPYILDFYIPSAHLVIELDGSQHYEETGKEQDRQRDAYLKGRGLQVLRYSNLDVNQHFSGVCEDILHRLPPVGEAVSEAD